MTVLLEDDLQQHREAVYELFRAYQAKEKPFLLRSELLDEFEAFCATEQGSALRETAFAGMIRSAQEAIIFPPSIYFSIRPNVAQWSYVHFQMEELFCRFIPVSEFLQVKERLVEHQESPGDWVLEIDLAPFERGFPRLKETRSIGRGVEYLNRHLSSRLFDQLGKGDQTLFDFMRMHQVQGQQLMLNGSILNLEELQQALRRADEILEKESPEAQWPEVETVLRKIGFEPGWGRSVSQIRERMQLLSDILEAPDPNGLERFLGNLPMIFTIAVISPHGYFGQANVLGKPDTGGQVVYILDQVRALEREMRKSIHDQGLDMEPEIMIVTRLIPDAGDTACDQRIERVDGTHHTRILRVPFRNEAGETVPHWISRFDIWPYLERFARDAGQEMLTELDRQPDFIIGNYSDGNLVASMLSQYLGVTQCNIAHALEKTKYLYSDLYWKEHESQHHFSCQFTADLISMNTADFIITSTYQEIAGTRDSVGQYESYGAFTMPGLYRVVNGIDVFDPKFNIVSPGADPQVFFPFTERGQRIGVLTEDVRALVHGGARPDARGILEDHDKPLLFAMSRLDRIKNPAGLVQWYAECPELRKQANLFVVGGYIDATRSDDEDERSQIEQMHQLIDQYELEAQVRWVEMQPDKSLVGELYRCVADTGGAFVQPALFEAFGLTVVEAMSCGLPTFATCYGGPMEIIETGVSGFHINPNHGGEAAEFMADFFRKCRSDSGHWERISQGALARVESRYTWRMYARQLLTLSRIYGFWKYNTNIERQETQRYLEMFYGLMYKNLAANMTVTPVAVETI